MVYETAFLWYAGTDGNTKLGLDLETQKLTYIHIFAGNDYDDDCNEKYDITL